MRTIHLMTAAAILAGYSATSAQDTLPAKSPIIFSASAGMENGQIISGKYRGSELGDRVWLGRSYLDLGVQIQRDRLTAVLKLEGEIWFNTYTYEFNKDRNNTPFRPYSKLNLLDGYVTVSPFGNDKPILQVTAGFFEYKCDPYARNLGEYLFRSGTYPPFLITNFDSPEAVLTGVKLSSTIARVLKQDLIFSTERQIMPYFDFSLSYLAGYRSPAGVIDVGAGVSFYRLFSVNESYTTPKFDDNRYLIGPGDTGYYSFGGTKVMGRIGFDPKPLFGSPRFFGANDLQLYGEGAILGVKSYENADTLAIPGSSYYADILKRMPLMVGLNVPTFKVLDFLTFEAEWYGWNYPNAYYRRQGQSYEMPIPAQFPGSYTESDYDRNNWKWSFYAKKTLLKNFSIIGQIANDHMRHRIFIELYNDEEELMIKDSDWYWMLKLEAKI